MRRPDAGAPGAHEERAARYVPYALCMLLSLALYANTFGHQFALDDAIVIGINESVGRGLRGIPGIFGEDLFDSYNRLMNTPAQLAGGRYRPLSVSTFAIEQELIGTRHHASTGPACWDANGDGRQDPDEDVNGDGLHDTSDCVARGFTLRHVDNALLYGLTVCLLYHFLSTVVLPGRRGTALLIALLFLAHPVHVEAVANVKSRDEILAGLFVLLALQLAHRHAAGGRTWHGALACVASLCALLSKETGVVLLVLVPLSLHLFQGRRLIAARNAGLLGGMLLTFGAYAAARSRLVSALPVLRETEILKDPYLLATPVQQWATKLFVLFKYAALLVVPHPLSSDYGYRSIPYVDFSAAGPWLGILLLAGLVVAGALALRARHWLAFAVAVYLLPLLLVGNLFFNVGGTMGERFLFLPSVGYCMGLGALLAWVSERPGLRPLAAAAALVVFALYGAKTVVRNRAWENDATLAFTDVRTMPESVLLNGNAAWCSIELAERPGNAADRTRLLREAIRYGEKAVSLNPRYVTGLVNLGLAHARLGEYDRARELWETAFALHPQHPSRARYLGELSRSFYRQGFEFNRQGEWGKCAESLRKAVELAPENAQFWRALGNCANDAGRREQALKAWERAGRLEAGRVPRPR